MARPQTRPASSRPCALEFRSLFPPCSESADPGRAGGVWLFPLPARGITWRATESPELCGSLDTYRHPQTPLQLLSEPGHTHPAPPEVLHCGASSTTAPSWRGGRGEKEPALKFWALRPARGAGWGARRCWPSLCGSAWRPGLPLWVRSPLPRGRQRSRVRAERWGCGEDLEAGSNSES